MPRKMQRKLKASKSKGIKHMMEESQMKKMMKQKMMDKKMGMPKGKGTMMVRGY